MASEPRLLDIEAVIRAVRAQAECAGSLRALGRRWQVTAAHLSRVVRKQKAPGDAVLRHLSLREVSRYEPAEARHGQ